MPHDQQAIKQTKRNCRHHEQIHRSDAIGMIAKECLPALGWWASPPGHVLGHTGLPNLNAQLEKFTMNPGCSPQRVGDAHLADQSTYLRRYRRLPAARSRLPSPI